MYLSDVTIGIKTFLRDDMMMKAVTGIAEWMPETHVIIADDGKYSPDKTKFYLDMYESSHHKIKAYQLPFDSGFGAKSNFIADKLDTPYLLIGSDDFEFGLAEVRNGIEKLVETLDQNSYQDIASGRVNERPHEYILRDEDGVITEIAVYYPPEWNLNFCDLTVNYSLIRRKVFEKVRWDDDVKIGGGEHGAWFVDVKRAGFHVVRVPSVNINEQKTRCSEEYRQYRNRARRPERPCFVKRGIKKYILADGTVDYEEKTS